MALAGAGVLPAGETFQCTQTIDAYDCNDPTRLIGRFAPPTSFEIEEYVASARMFRVLHKSPGGKEIRALCRPEALGKKPPEPPRTDFSSSKGQLKTGAAPDAGSPQPPIFAALQQFQLNVWETPSSKFALQQSRYGFRWVSLAENNESRWSPLPTGQPLKFLGKPLFEAIVRFKNNRPEEIRLLFFNRGDAKKDLAENDFKTMLKDVETSLDQWMGAKGLEAEIPGNVADTQRKSWFKFPLRVDLEWSFTQNAGGGEGFRAEFIRLMVTPYDGKTDVASLVKPAGQASPAAAVKSTDLKARVKRDAGGDVYLDGVPMVDQGQKGYCVCASCERVMRYFGLAVDQNEMAKIANTATTGGTSTDAMHTALKKMGEQFSIAVQELIGFDVKGFIKEVEDYNQLAGKNNKPEIVLPTSGAINVSEIYKSMDPELLRQANLSRNADGKVKFKQEITSAIDQGVPLLWSVELGLVEETPALPQTRGGHMRLIIGYNEKTSEIIYTDSWGTGHEFKKMKVDNAHKITRSLYTVMPRS